MLPVSRQDSLRLAKEGFQDLLPKDWCYKTINDIDGIIIPLPEKVYILGEHIPKIVTELFNSNFFISSQLATLRKLTKWPPSLGKFLNSLFYNKHDPIVLRTLAIRSAHFKKSLYKSPSLSGLNKIIIEEYQKLPMPRFIWLIEISNAANCSQDREEERKIFGEIIIDATANKFGLSLLAMHLPGALFKRNLENNTYSTLPIPDDKEYRHLLRNL